MRTTTLYLLAGPKTFRRASKTLFREGNKKTTGYGGNLQNWEVGLRRIITSDGWSSLIENKLKYFLQTGDLTIFTDEELNTIRILIQRDQSGAEALIVSYECDFRDYRKLFINNIKPHVYVGLKLFVEIWKEKAKEHGLAVGDGDIDKLNCTAIEHLKANPHWKSLDKLIKSSDNWSLQERYYYLAKQTCHSANYGITEGRFILNILEKSGGKIVLTKDEGRHFLQTYRGLFPEIPERNERIKEQVKKHKLLYNLFGHPYIITNENITEETYKEYYAWTAQSTVAEITRTAYCDMQEYIWDTNKRWDVLIDGHDSIVMQCPLREVKEADKQLETFMNIELTAPSDGTKFRMKSESMIGFNWGKKKGDSNPLGLQEPEWFNN